MKYRVFIIFILIIIGLTSCNKDKNKVNRDEIPVELKEWKGSFIPINSVPVGQTKEIAGYVRANFNCPATVERITDKYIEKGFIRDENNSTRLKNEKSSVTITEFTDKDKKKYSRIFIDIKPEKK